MPNDMPPRLKLELYRLFVVSTISALMLAGWIYLPKECYLQLGIIGIALLIAQAAYFENKGDKNG